MPRFVRHVIVQTNLLFLMKRAPQYNWSTQQIPAILQAFVTSEEIFFSEIFFEILNMIKNQFIQKAQIKKPAEEQQVLCHWSIPPKTFFPLYTGQCVQNIRHYLFYLININQ